MAGSVLLVIYTNNNHECMNCNIGRKFENTCRTHVDIHLMTGCKAHVDIHIFDDVFTWVLGRENLVSCSVVCPGFTARRPGVVMDLKLHNCMII